MASESSFQSCSRPDAGSATEAALRAAPHGRSTQDVTLRLPRGTQG